MNTPNTPKRTANLAILRASPHLLVHLVTEGPPRCYHVIENALPPDATALRCTYDYLSDTVQILVASEHFAPVIEGAIPPTLEPPTVTTITVDELVAALAFARAIIRSGEPWSERCEQVIDYAIERATGAKP